MTEFSITLAPDSKPQRRSRALLYVGTGLLVVGALSMALGNYIHGVIEDIQSRNIPKVVRDLEEARRIASSGPTAQSRAGAELMVLNLERFLEVSENSQRYNERTAQGFFYGGLLALVGGVASLASHRLRARKAGAQVAKNALELAP